MILNVLSFIEKALKWDNYCVSANLIANNCKAHYFVYL